MKGNRLISYAHVSREQTKEFGMLTVLIVSFLAFYLHKYNLSGVIFILSLLTLLCPVIFYPFAMIWFGISKLMGKLSTSVLLTVVFFVIVIPVALIRRMLHLDGLKLKQFKKTKTTVLVNREHIYVDSDLLHTF